MTTWPAPAYRLTRTPCPVREAGTLRAAVLSRQMRHLAREHGDHIRLGDIRLADDGEAWTAHYAPPWSIAGWVARGSTAVEALSALRGVLMGARCHGHESEVRDVYRRLPCPRS